MLGSSEREDGQGRLACAVQAWMPGRGLTPRHRKQGIFGREEPDQIHALGKLMRLR